MSTSIKLLSPDGHITLTFRLSGDGEEERRMAAGTPLYRADYKGKPLLNDSQLGLMLEGQPDMLDGFVLAGQYEVSEDTEWKPLYGERDTVRDRYNGLTFILKEQAGLQRELRIAFRAYNEGIAFRYEITEAGMPGSRLVIAGERSEFHFPSDCLAYEHHGAEGEYAPVPVGELKRNCERPLTVAYSCGTYASLTEAAMNDYARMLLEAKDGVIVSQLSGLVTEYVGYDNMDTSLTGERADALVRTLLPFESPWRVVIVGDRPGDLTERNDMILNLSEPCALDDTDWIKPGKLLREMTLTKEGAFACIDFAKAFDFRYVMFDWGWYGDPFDNRSLCTNPVNDVWYFRMEEGVIYPKLDLREIVQYADAKDIGIVLYLDRRAVEQQLEQFLPVFKEWGIKAIKIGFTNCGPQYWTKWLHDVVKRCAEYEILVNIHDAYRPTGFSRTYPNLLTQEGIRGNEHMPTSRHNCTLPFTRFVAGAGDYTICYYTDRKQTTYAHQLAMSVIAYSPMQSVFWYDKPSDYKGEADAEFFKHLPTVWNDSRVVDGSIGEYAVVARRSGEDWFVGSITNEEARETTFKLDFLKPGVEYVANIYADLAGDRPTRTNVSITKLDVDSTSQLTAVMAANGGQALHIVPIR